MSPCGEGKGEGQGDGWWSHQPQTAVKGYKTPPRNEKQNTWQGDLPGTGTSPEMSQAKTLRVQGRVKQPLISGCSGRCEAITLHAWSQMHLPKR